MPVGSDRPTQEVVQVQKKKKKRAEEVNRAPFLALENPENVSYDAPSRRVPSQLAFFSPEAKAIGCGRRASGVGRRGRVTSLHGDVLRGIHQLALTKGACPRGPPQTGRPTEGRDLRKSASRRVLGPERWPTLYGREDQLEQPPH